MFAEKTPVSRVRCHEPFPALSTQPAKQANAADPRCGAGMDEYERSVTNESFA